MIWACDTGTKSAASKNSPTAIWCSIAQRRGAPKAPARIACSSSLRRIGLFARHLDKAVRAERRGVEHEAFERRVAGSDDFVRQPLGDANDRAGAATPRRRIAKRDVGLAGEDVDNLRPVEVVGAGGLAPRRAA